MQRSSDSRKRYYPILLDLTDRQCLVVGGGNVAERKVKTLLQSAAVVTIVSPQCTESLSLLAGQGRITWHRRDFSPDDIGKSFLVIAATSDSAVNQAVYQAATSAGCLVNVIDNPELCNFIVPSVVERGDLMVAVSTSGASPALAKKVRLELEAMFGEEYTEFLEILAALRKRALGEIPEEGMRQELFRRLVNSEILSLLREGRRDDAERLAEQIYRQGAVPGCA
ncbi:MAG: bifunctional precorrin-2 dehydrogenase/sirohydrochlorin ferrochelatase [Nitrospirota bacterium]|nr:bifunctional precorrin-2 dehydrogenase/sirohydrochlorin ferrochelatase [Nitrospirota bacterium]